MPRKHSLTRSDFDALRGVPGRRAHGSFFSIVVTPLPAGIDGPKFACVVSKKIATKAVERNRIQRSCRTALRAQLKNASAANAYVLHAKREAKDTPSKELMRDIEKLFARTR